MHADAATVEDYLSGLPEDRRDALAKVREVVLANLPEGYVEAMNWGMIAYEVPLSVSGKTYNGRPLMYAALASQKRHMAIYLCGLYCVPGLEQRFRDRHAEAGRKLDMGKACIRFRSLDALDLDAVAETISAVAPQEYAAITRAAHQKR